MCAIAHSTKLSLFLSLSLPLPFLSLSLSLSLSAKTRRTKMKTQDITQAINDGPIWFPKPARGTEF